jgi:hypothetical protein
MAIDMGARIAIMNTVLGQIPANSITNAQLVSTGIVATVNTLLQDIVTLEGTGWTNQTLVGNANAITTNTNNFTNLVKSPLFTGTITAPAITTTGGIASGGLVTGQTMTITGANDGIDIGAPSTVNTPTIDLHSSGTNIDYDVRIMATAGDTVNGDGLLTIKALAGVVTQYLTATLGYKNLGFMYATHFTGTVVAGAAATVVNHNLGYNPMIFFSGSEGAISLTYNYTTGNLNQLTIYNSGTTNWVGNAYMY